MRISKIPKMIIDHITRSIALSNTRASTDEENTGRFHDKIKVRVYVQPVSS